MHTLMENLAQTLDCGQCFRWDRLQDGTWEGVAYGKYLHITEENFSGVLRDPFWADYFDMGTDYAGIRAGLCAKDSTLAEAAHYAPEIHILRQEPWEALCSFILSQCNNIKRIKGMAARLCRAYGRNIGNGRFAFPEAETLALADEGDLRALGFGFRAPYVISAAKSVAQGSIDFKVLKVMPLKEARDALTGLSGVGPKVADCTLLYGLHRMDAFPMDVWMKRAMKVLFPGKDPSWFGPYAGVAQQYIFHYSRHHPELFQCA